MRNKNNKKKHIKEEDDEENEEMSREILDCKIINQ